MRINDTESTEFKNNFNTLLKLPIISYWKRKLPTVVTHTTILGSADSCFENCFGKLIFFGLSINDILTHDHLKKYISFLEKNTNQGVHDSLCRLTVAGYLYSANYSNDLIYEIITKRIDSLYDFITASPLKYNIYIEPADFKVPGQYKPKKLVNPVLYEKGELTLPLIYDIFIFYFIYDKISTDFKKKIDTIIKYISDRRYQSFDYGYGLIKGTHNRFHFMGWSAHLPFFNTELSTDYFGKGLIYRMVLFSKFKNPSIQKWINERIIALDEFKQDDFKYCFPNDLLPEIKNTYFMNGRHMALNEDRKKKVGKIIESTYYMHLVGTNHQPLHPV